ncbi:MAG: hypothetical protein WBM00_01570 [Solirubrobacterales bacterium]
MRSSTTLKWIGLALLGIAIAAGISIAASRLASRQIGLASEPISAGDALAPAAQPRSVHPSRPRHRHRPTTTPAVTTPPTTTIAPPPTPEVPETVAPEPQPEEPSHTGSGDGEHGGGGGGGGGHADD